MLISLIISFFINIIPPSQFICDGDLLEARIYNNLNGDYQLLKNLEDIDEGAFVVLKWREARIMIPRTFRSGEISFTDRKWWWSYKENGRPPDLEHPRLEKLSNSGYIRRYECIFKED
tara:strand:+ start:533 stop:886 length:354 start_codon:yes stop_codon:yes gene_type:complete